MREEDKCAIGTEGRVKYFLKEILGKMSVSIKSERIWILQILRKVLDF